MKAANVRQWAHRGRLHARALDGAGRPLYFQHDIEAIRAETLSRFANTGPCVTLSPEFPPPVCPEPERRDEVAEPPHLPDVHVPVRLMLYPELDPAALSAFSAQLGQLAADTTRMLAEAVRAGLSVEGVTVHLNGTVSDDEYP